jgi:hypothetical protein
VAPKRGRFGDNCYTVGVSPDLLPDAQFSEALAVGPVINDPEGIIREAICV